MFTYCECSVFAIHRIEGSLFLIRITLLKMTAGSGFRRKEGRDGGIIGKDGREGGI